MGKGKHHKGAQRPLIRRTTALADGLVALAQSLGVDTTNVRVPVKREPTWTVSRRAPRK
jgi:hypothetical protein